MCGGEGEVCVEVRVRYVWNEGEVCVEVEV